MSANIKRTERSQINDLRLHLKLLEKTRTSKTQNKQERNNKNKGQNYEKESQKKYKELMQQKAGFLKK
jgi:hypothetical protein